MKICIAIFMFLLMSCPGLSQSQIQKTFHFIGAHPDDETALGEVLAKYARQGHKVIVVSATDGKDGRKVCNPGFKHKIIT